LSIQYKPFILSKLISTSPKEKKVNVEKLFGFKLLTQNLKEREIDEPYFVPLNK
jgi:hypothetical protein